MKKSIYICVLVCFAITLANCGNKKKTDDIIAPRVVKVKPAEPQKMQEYKDEREVKWVEGRMYHVTVLRQPSDSLPMVKDENGQKYIDNIFYLTVKRNDGSVFFKRSFTKKDFVKYINADYQKTGVLEGVVFDKVDGNYLVFGASVGHPQTDEYIPLVVKLSRMGDVAISQDTQLDTNSPQGEQTATSDDEGV